MPRLKRRPQASSRRPPPAGRVNGGRVCDLMARPLFTVGHRAAASARARRVAADSTLRESDGRRVGAAVVEAAQRWGADLIVAGTHGRRGLDRLFLGRVAEGVARTAPVSVLLVRGGTR